MSPKGFSPTPVQASPSHSPTPLSHQPVSIPSPSQAKPYTPKSVRFVPRPPRKSSPSSSPSPVRRPLLPAPRPPQSRQSGVIFVEDPIGCPVVTDICVWPPRIGGILSWKNGCVPIVCRNTTRFPVAPVRWNVVDVMGNLHPPPQSSRGCQEAKSAFYVPPSMSLRTCPPLKPDFSYKAAPVSAQPSTTPASPQRTLLPPSTFEPFPPDIQARDSESRPTSSSSSDSLPPVLPITYFGRHPAPSRQPEQ